MTYYITFLKLKNKYIKVSSPNKFTAIKKVSTYRDDCLVFSEDEKRFSFKEAEEFNSLYQEVTIQQLDKEYCTTRQKWMLVDDFKNTEFCELREDELEEKLKKIVPGGVFFEPENGKKYFVKKHGKNHKMYYLIARVKSFTKDCARLEEPKEEKQIDKIETTFEVVP